MLRSFVYLLFPPLLFHYLILLFSIDVASIWNNTTDYLYSHIVKPEPPIVIVEPFDLQSLNMSEILTIAPSHPFRVCVLGSGNWGTTIAKIVAENTAANPELFQAQVNMWVYEEEVQGRKLTEIINTDHENVKYLPGIKLPKNIIAVPSLLDTVKDANVIIFNIPHQFLPNVSKQLEGHIHPHTRAISCLKGVNVTKNSVHTPPDYIYRHLGIHCGALSGANLAPEIALEKFSETTIAYRIPTDPKNVLPADQISQDFDKDAVRALFHRPYFHVKVVDDVTGICLAGALKNVVAVAAGLVDGYGWGENSKAAVMRVGIVEMVKFGATFFNDSDPKTYTEESAGLADLITSCAGGRNHHVGKVYAERLRENPDTPITIQDVEKELLNGQSAQGLVTAEEVYAFLKAKGRLAEFPLLVTTYRIVFEGEKIEDLPNMLAINPMDGKL